MFYKFTKDKSFYDENSLREKISALITVKNGFNRGALIFGYDKPVKVRGKVYKEIPSSMKFAHPRDLGIIEADPVTWRLKAVQWRNAFYIVPAKDMIHTISFWYLHISQRSIVPDETVSNFVNPEKPLTSLKGPLFTGPIPS